MDLFPELRLERTLEVLATTENDAAAVVLVEALANADPRWQPRVLEALLQRRSEAAGSEVLRRWSRMGNHQKELVARRPGWISDALQRALHSGSEELFASACLAARESLDFSQIPHLVATVLRRSSPTSTDLACQAVLSLAERLGEDLHQPRDYRTRRNPQLQRAGVLGSLEKAARQFEHHGRRELLEALLLVADRRNATVNHILCDPSDRAFVPLLDVLATSPRPGILDFLLEALDDPQTPLATLHAMMRRRDPRFVRLLCRKVGAAPGPAVRNNLKRVENVPVVRQPEVLLQLLDPDQQPGAVQLALASGIPRQQALDLITCVLQEGSVAGRRSAALALASFNGPDSDALAMRAIGDDDEEVKATIARQLRQREIPDAVPLLVSLLASPQAEVRRAARENLADITFQRYLDAYDQWDEATRSMEGQLVLRVDPQAVGKLVGELQSSSRSRQRRALEITQLLGLGGQVEPTLIELAADDDQYVRLEAARLLAPLASPLAREVLRTLVHDKSTLVQDAARQGLADAGLAEGAASGTAAFPRGSHGGQASREVAV